MASNFRYRIAMKTASGNVTAECAFIEDVVKSNDVSVTMREWAQSVINRFRAHHVSVSRAGTNGEFQAVDHGTLSLTIPA